MKGRVALVTGAARGIGRAIAERFREEGAVVLAPSRAELDLLSNESIERWCAALAQPIDVLVKGGREKE